MITTRGVESLRRYLMVWEMQAQAGPPPPPTVTEMRSIGLSEHEARGYVAEWDEAEELDAWCDVVARVDALRDLLAGVA
jgi:hypothetical protein